LSPLQALTPAPYAIFAENIGSGGLVSGTYGSALTFNNASNQFTGAFTGNGANLTNVNAATLGGLTTAGFWKIRGNSGTVPGTNFVGTTDNQPLELWVNSQRAVRLEPTTNGAPNVIGGAAVNFVSGNVFGATMGATIAGGGGAGTDFSGAAINTTNTVSGNFGTVGGGGGNVITGNAFWSTVPGGYFNTVGGACSFAAGGNAQANCHNSFVWSDSGPPFYGPPFACTANGQFAVRAYGGVFLEANVQVGSGGGDYRQLSLGGGNSTGFLYGSYPKWGDGIHLGYNYYADASGGDAVANSGGATSRLTVGYGFISLNVGGVNSAPSTQRLLANSSGVTVNGTFNNQSDRNAKQDFTPVSPAQILDRVTRLPVTEWSYKEDAATRHIGPVAQDFHALFNLGTDERHIAPMDEGGVALAAIQGLDQKFQQKIAEKEHEIQRLKQQNEVLERRMEALAAQVEKLAESR